MKIVLTKKLKNQYLETKVEDKLREFEYSILEALQQRQKALDPKVFKADKNLKEIK